MKKSFSFIAGFMLVIIAGLAQAVTPTTVGNPASVYAQNPTYIPVSLSAGGTVTPAMVTAAPNNTVIVGPFNLQGSTATARFGINGTFSGFNVSAYGGFGAPSGWNTYGYAGDLSLVTSGATLYANCIAGTSLSTATYGAAVGNQTLASTAAGVA